MTSQQLRAKLHTALQELATDNLRNSATALLATLGYLRAFTDKMQ